MSTPTRREVVVFCWRELVLPVSLALVMAFTALAALGASGFLACLNIGLVEWYWLGNLSVWQGWQSILPLETSRQFAVVTATLDGLLLWGGVHQLKSLVTLPR